MSGSVVAESSDFCAEKMVFTAVLMQVEDEKPYLKGYKALVEWMLRGTAKAGPFVRRFFPIRASAAEIDQVQDVMFRPALRG